MIDELRIRAGVWKRILGVRALRAHVRYKAGRAKHLFIHVPKCAGIAVKKSEALKPRLVMPQHFYFKSMGYAVELHRSLGTLEGRHYFDPHARLSEFHPKIRAALQPVAVVRNPFSRAFSQFSYRQSKRARRGAPLDFSADTFAEYLESRHDLGGRDFYWHREMQSWYSQKSYVVDEDGRLACDLLRLECLSQDVQRYFGVPLEKPRNSSHKYAPHYTEVYTDRTRQIVADWYAEDIETFGFDFTGPATRHVVFADR